VYEINDYEPHIVEAMIQFLYSLDYADDAFDVRDLYSQMRFNILVNTIADKYDIGPLRILATSKFEKLVAADGWNHHNFSALLKEVYESTCAGDAIRKVVVAGTWKNLAALMDKDEFRAMMESVGILGVELAQRASAYAQAQPKKYRCEICKSSAFLNFG